MWLMRKPGRDARSVGSRMCAPTTEGPAAAQAETSEASPSRTECRARSGPAGHSHGLPRAPSTHAFTVTAATHLHSDHSHRPSQGSQPQDFTRIAATHLHMITVRNAFTGIAATRLHMITATCLHRDRSHISSWCKNRCSHGQGQNLLSPRTGRPARMLTKTHRWFL